MADPDVEIIREYYRHFRNSAVALSVTIIGVSGAMLIRLEQLQTVWFIKGPFQITFVVCIILSLLLQYRNYQGYMNFTYSEFIEFTLQKDPAGNAERIAAGTEQAKDLRGDSNKAFEQLRDLAKWDFNLCVCGVAAFFIFNAGLEIGQWFSS